MVLRGRYTPEVTHGDLEGLDDNDHTQYVNAVSDTASIDLTLAGQSISAVALPAGIDHGGLAGLGGDDHPQYLLVVNYKLINGTAQGQMLFWDAAAGKWTYTEITELFWDDVNKRLGIGTDNPGSLLHINSAEVVSTTLLTLESDINNNNEYNEILFKVTGGLNYGAIRSCVGAASGRSFMSFHTTTGGTLTRRVTIQHDGKVGFGTYNPETLLEMVSTAPYLTLHNIDTEDTDGGRESRLNFKGHQSGGEETTLARIEVGHDGVVDDEKGYLDIFINDGDDGNTPTKIVRIDSDSAVFQPATDSITFFQVLDADGGIPIFNVDSTNERVGINNSSPTSELDVTGTVTMTRLLAGGVNES